MRNTPSSRRSHCWRRRPASPAWTCLASIYGGGSNANCRCRCMFLSVYNFPDWPKSGRLFTSVHGEVESKDAFLVGGLLDHFGMAKSTDRVVIPSSPAVLHAPTRELIILRRPLVILGAVVEMYDIVDRSISYFSQQGGLRT